MHWPGPRQAGAEGLWVRSTTPSFWKAYLDSSSDMLRTLLLGISTPQNLALDVHVLGLKTPLDIMHQWAYSKTRDSRHKPRTPISRHPVALRKTWPVDKASLAQSSSHLLCDTRHIAIRLQGITHNLHPDHHHSGFPSLSPQFPTQPYLAACMPNRTIS